MMCEIDAGVVLKAEIRGSDLGQPAVTELLVDSEGLPWPLRPFQIRGNADVTGKDKGAKNARPSGSGRPMGEVGFEPSVLVPCINSSTEFLVIIAAASPPESLATADRANGLGSSALFEVFTLCLLRKVQPSCKFWGTMDDSEKLIHARAMLAAPMQLKDSLGPTR